MGVSALGEAVRIGLRSMGRRPIRTVLNAATTAVAIATVVTTMSLIAGSRRVLQHDLRALGRTTVEVHANPFAGAGHVTMDDVTLRGIRDAVGDLAADIVPARVGQFSGRSGDSPPVLLPVVGTSPGHLATYDGRIVRGRWLDDDDVRERRHVTVLDAEAARLLLGREDVVGEHVVFTRGEENLEVEVVGVLEDPFSLREQYRQFDTSQGARFLVARLLSFQNAYVPETLMPGRPWDTVLTRARSAEDVPRLRAALETWAYGPDRRLGEKGFHPPLLVWSRGEWVEDVTGTIDDFSILGNVIWMLVLLVAIVMIMTVTTVSVRERYREVAIRRTEGATRGAILAQFTVEGMLVSLLGGIAGVAIGWAAAVILSGLVDWPPSFEAANFALALGLAVLVGLGASALPARRAARLDPVKVLTRRRL